MNKRNSQARPARGLRWAARITGTLVAGLWLLVGITGAISEGFGPLDAESATMATLMVVSAVAVGVAWRREDTGGWLVVGCGLAHAVFALLAAEHNHLLAMSVMGLPLVVIGTLFLVTARLSGRQAVLQTKSIG
ncbi:MAG: hypothetical protein GYB65_24295 [Chloroflexi bacterium]|nr:hypothetical protein [Chloroflexota bacterium]